MLSFLSPVFLAGAAAAAVPIVLHLLKREPEPRVKFAAVKLLRQAPVEHTKKHRLRELLLLALRVTALVLLALAFARPFFASAASARSAGVTIVALDTSYSLSAPGRFERARQLAREAIGRVPSGDPVGVVTFDDQASVAVRPTADRALALSAVDEAASGFGGTRYRAALASAAQLIAGRRGTIVVVTDLQESGWDAGDRATVPEDARIEIADVGAPPPDLAVTAVQPQRDRVVATVHNAGPRARDARVHLAIDGAPAGEAMVSPGPNQSAEATFAVAAHGETAAVSVDDPDGIQADNVRYAVIGATREQPVAVVTGHGDLGADAFYVQQALTVGGYRPVALSGARLSAAQPGADPLAGDAAALVLSTQGLERRGREALAGYVRGGGGLLIAAGPDVDGQVIGDVLGGGDALRVTSQADAKPQARRLAPADVRHPIFQPFAQNAAALGLVTFRRATRIGGAGCQTLARFTSGDAAMIECAAGDGLAIVIASDLDNRWNDFPVHATFVPFLHEAIRYLSSARLRAAEYVVGDAPAGAPRRPGIATLTDPARPALPARRVAINVDPREADPSRISVDEFRAAVTHMKDAGASQARVEASQVEDRQHLWQYAVALLLVTLAAEGAIAARTA